MSLINNIKNVVGAFALLAALLVLPASGEVRTASIDNWIDDRFGQLEASIGSPLPSTIDELVAFADIPHDSDEQHYCLAQAVYFEARSEPVSGQIAVARVILNRVADKRYPDTICGVVFQNQKWVDRCQFSFACDGEEDRVHERAAWAMSERVASLAQRHWIPHPIGDATHYHADYVSPGWADNLVKTATVGRHIFYRYDLAGGSAVGE
ncbi:MAG: cell wall hydrolase [Alphaproteobacteria bacterium]